MASLDGARLAFQRPRIEVAPAALSSSGREAVELAASAGLHLDPWQQHVLDVGLGERADGRWAALEVALLASRQNGKGSILEALELAGLFLFGERLILHSAHEFKTCQEAFKRVRGLIEGTADLSRLVKTVRTAHGDEMVELTDGRRIRFVARSRNSGRGFTADRIVLDEAQNLPDSAVEAVMPTISARPNPQIWYTFTAPDRDQAPCDVIARLRRRALSDDPGSLAYLEWSAELHSDRCEPGCTEHDDPGDERVWARSNPALRLRIGVEHVQRERASMSPQGFARERLGVGRWPADAHAWGVIGEAEWAALADPASQALDPVTLAVDLAPDGSSAAVAAAGARPDGNTHVEVLEHRPGTGWLTERLFELVGKWSPAAVVAQDVGAGGAVLAALKASGLEVVRPDAPADGTVLLRPFAREVPTACAGFVELAGERRLRHLGTAELAAALAGAAKRKLANSWAWDRAAEGTDLTPLVAVTLAVWGHRMRALVPERERTYFFDPDATREAARA